MKYDKPKSNTWIRPYHHGYKMCCCDCGLVHRFDFRIVKRNGRLKVEFRGNRDNRATGQVRRWMKKK